jgi:predicted molibdopterin-dependent oxidoreductase YjgC
VVVPTADGTQPLQYVPVDAGLHPAGHRLGLHLGRVLYDDGVRVRMSPSLAKLRPSAVAHLHPRDAGSLGLTAGVLVAVESTTGAAELAVTFDPDLTPGTVYVPANLAETAGLGDAVAVTVIGVSEPAAESAAPGGTE